MPEKVGEAFIEFHADTKPVGREAKEGLDDAVKQQSGSFTKQGRDMATGLAAGFAAVKIFDFAKDAFAESREAQRAMKQTEAVLRSTGGAAGVTADHVGDLADEVEGLAAIDGDAVRESENLLLTFTNLRNETGKGRDIFDRATKATVDMAAAMGGEASGSAIQLGKALNDPTAGLAALTRVGVSFSEQQKETIKQMVATGDVAGAQALILDELEKEFGGSAAAQATGVDRMNVAIGNLKEQIGTGLSPAIEFAADLMTKTVGIATELPPPVQTVALVITGLGATAVAASKAIQGVSGVVDTFRDTANKLRPATDATATSMGPAAGGLTWAALGVGAALGVAAIAWHEYNKAEGERKAERNELIQSLKDTGSTAGGVTQLLGPLNDKLGQTDANMGLLTQGLERGDDSFGTFATRLENIAGTTTNADIQLQLLHQQIDDGKISAGTYTDELLRLIDTHQLTIPQAADLATRFDEIADRSDEAKQSTEGQAAATQFAAEVYGQYNVVAQDRVLNDEEIKAAVEQYTEAQKVSTDSVTEATQSYRDYSDALRDANSVVSEIMNTQFGLEGAQRNVAAAERDLTESVKDNGTTLDEWTEKGGKNQEAVEGLLEANAQLLGKVFEMNGAGKEFNDTQAAQRVALEQTLTQMGFNRDEIDKYLRAWDAVPREITTQVGVDDAPLRAWLRGFGRNFADQLNIAGRELGLARGGNVHPVPFHGGLMAGGTIPALGGFAVVGEQGPELVQFGGNAAVFPHDQFQMQMLAAVRAALVEVGHIAITPKFTEMLGRMSAEISDAGRDTTKAIAVTNKNLDRLVDAGDKQTDRLIDASYGAASDTMQFLEASLMRQDESAHAIYNVLFNMSKITQNMVAGVAEILRPGTAGFLRSVREASGGAFTGSNEGLWWLHKNEFVFNSEQMKALSSMPRSGAVFAPTVNVVIDTVTSDNARAAGQLVADTTVLAMRHMLPDVRAAITGG